MVDLWELEDSMHVMFSGARLLNFRADMTKPLIEEPRWGECLFVSMIKYYFTAYSTCCTPF